MFTSQASLIQHLHYGKHHESWKAPKVLGRLPWFPVDVPLNQPVFRCFKGGQSRRQCHCRRSAPSVAFALPGRTVQAPPGELLDGRRGAMVEKKNDFAEPIKCGFPIKIFNW